MASTIIVGAGGNTGSTVVVKFLKQKHHFARIAVLKRPNSNSSLEDAKAKGVEVIEGSMTDASLFKGFDVLVSLVGMAALDAQISLIDAAIDGGIRHIYPSEYTLDIDDPELAHGKLFSQKAAVRRHLREKVKVVKDLKFATMTTGGFTEWTLTPLFGFDAEKKTFNCYGVPEAEVSLLSLNDAARYTVESILIPFPEGESERNFKLSSGTRSWNELLQVINKIYDVTYSERCHSPSEAAAQETKFEEAGNFGMAFLWYAKAMMGSGRAVLSRLWDNDKFAWEPESVESVFERLRDA